AAAGMTIAIAGAMTGSDLTRVERLPDTAGMNSEVPILRGHMVYYGAPVEQAIRLAGATPVAVGGATRAQAYQLEGALNERAAAGKSGRRASSELLPHWRLGKSAITPQCGRASRGISTSGLRASRVCLE